MPAADTPPTPPPQCLQLLIHIRDIRDYKVLRKLHPQLSLDDLVKHYGSTQKVKTNADSEAYDHFRDAILRFLPLADFPEKADLSQWDSAACTARVDKAFESALNTAQECFEVLMQRPQADPDAKKGPIQELSPLFSEIFQGFHCISAEQVCCLLHTPHPSVLASAIGAPRQLVVHSLRQACTGLMTD